MLLLFISDVLVVRAEVYQNVSAVLWSLSCFCIVIYLTNSTSKCSEICFYIPVLCFFPGKACSGL